MTTAEATEKAAAAANYERYVYNNTPQAIK
jgi:hypothetical protein